MSNPDENKGDISFKKKAAPQKRRDLHRMIQWRLSLRPERHRQPRCIEDVHARIFTLPHLALRRQTRCKVNRLSGEDILKEANSLSERWPSLPLDDRRKVAEAICEKIEIGQEGKDRKITITYSGKPSSEGLCKNLTSL